MNPAQYVNLARLAALGALGSGASGGVTNNGSTSLLGSPVAPATTVDYTSAAHICKTGRVLVIADITASKNGGTIAAGDQVTLTLQRDIGGTPVQVGGDKRVGAITTGTDVAAAGSLSYVDTVTPGSTHTYSIQAAVNTAGHTAGILADEAQVTVIDL